jgi:hypothetical protein
MTKEVEHQHILLQSREQTIETLNEQLSNFFMQLSEESLQKVKIELNDVHSRYSKLEESSKDLMCEKEDLQIKAEQLMAKFSFYLGTELLGNSMDYLIYLKDRT